MDVYSAEITEIALLEEKNLKNDENPLRDINLNEILLYLREIFIKR